MSEKDSSRSGSRYSAYLQDQGQGQDETYYDDDNDDDYGQSVQTAKTTAGTKHQRGRSRSPDTRSEKRVRRNIVSAPAPSASASGSGSATASASGSGSAISSASTFSKPYQSLGQGQTQKPTLLDKLKQEQRNQWDTQQRQKELAYNQVYYRCPPMDSEAKKQFKNMWGLDCVPTKVTPTTTFDEFTNFYKNKEKCDNECSKTTGIPYAIRTQYLHPFLSDLTNRELKIYNDTAGYQTIVKKYNAIYELPLKERLLEFLRKEPNGNRVFLQFIGISTSRKSLLDVAFHTLASSRRKSEWSLAIALLKEIKKYYQTDQIVYNVFGKYFYNILKVMSGKNNREMFAFLLDFVDFNRVSSDFTIKNYDTIFRKSDIYYEYDENFNNNYMTFLDVYINQMKNNCINLGLDSKFLTDFVFSTPEGKVISKQEIDILYCLLHILPTPDPARITSLTLGHAGKGSFGDLRLYTLATQMLEIAEKKLFHVDSTKKIKLILRSFQEFIKWNMIIDYTKVNEEDVTTFIFSLKKYLLD